ncbi:MAG: hypothetical protein AAF202_07125, partial [Pseudomonadota bacterium]
WEISKRQFAEDKEREAEQAKEEAAAAKAQSTDGPAVVKVSKGRKLVAAGMAEETEIAAEVEAEVTTGEEPVAAPAEEAKTEE